MRCRRPDSAFRIPHPSPIFRVVSNNDASDEKPSPISRLTAAFAKMLGASSSAEDAEEPATPAAPPGVTPRGIVEALLFVGSPDDQARTAGEIAATMRDVSAEEVSHLVDELNELYERDDAPYRIINTQSGYRMRLDGAHASFQAQQYGTSRPARLSQPALEVLSVVAYRQPVRAAEIDSARGKRSAAALAQLVRRQLVTRQSTGSPSDAVYRTSDRFLRVFDLADPNQLPRVAELDD